jgi:BMFP domain-containing protein YqiC
MRAELRPIRAALQGAAGHFDLTTRSEFDVQAKVLERSPSASPSSRRASLP